MLQTELVQQVILLKRCCKHENTVWQTCIAGLIAAEFSPLPQVVLAKQQEHSIIQCASKRPQIQHSLPPPLHEQPPANGAALDVIDGWLGCRGS
jgi:hypothetical protein